MGNGSCCLNRSCLSKYLEFGVTIDSNNDLSDPITLPGITTTDLGSSSVLITLIIRSFIVSLESSPVIPFSGNFFSFGGPNL